VPGSHRDRCRGRRHHRLRALAREGAAGAAAGAVAGVRLAVAATAAPGRALAGSPVLPAQPRLAAGRHLLPEKLLTPAISV